MEGVKFIVNKGLSNYFQVNYIVVFSIIGEFNYYFGVIYVGIKQLSFIEVFFVLVGDMDNSGSFNVQVIYQLGFGFRFKMVIQIQQLKFVNWQVDGEYWGFDFIVVVILGNLDVFVGLGIFVVYYFQSIMFCLVLGGELVYYWWFGEEGIVMFLVGKYILNNWLVMVMLGQVGMYVIYYYKVSDQLQVGVEFEVSIRMQDISVFFGYQLDLFKVNFFFKGFVDSNWIVGVMLEKKFLFLFLILVFGVFLNYCKNKFQCGFGFIIG